MKAIHASFVVYFLFVRRPHCIRRGNFRNPWGTRTCSCYTGPKIAKHAENRENTYGKCIARGWFRMDFPTDHSLLWLPRSRKGQACANTWEITWHALRVGTMFRWILKVEGWACIYNFQTWATSDFVPIEGQFVVFLALTDQIIVFGLVNITRACTRGPHLAPKGPASLIVRIFPSPHGIRTGPYGSRKTERTDVPLPIWNPQGPLGCLLVNLTKPVKYM